MKHKYYISAVTSVGFIGLYYCVDFSLNTIGGITKITEMIEKDGYEKVVILFF